MSSNLKWILIISSSFSNLIFGFTSPVVHIYFMSLIEPSVYSSVNFIESGLAAIMNTILSKKKKRYLLKRFAIYILILDTIFFSIISFISPEHILIRFFGLAIINSILNTVWFIMLNDVINHSISGADLTDFEVLQKSWNLYSSLIGAGIGIFISNQISINLAIIFQIIASIVIAISDGYVFKRLKINLK